MNNAALSLHCAAILDLTVPQLSLAVLTSSLGVHEVNVQ
jgi:hypothetical protein